MAINVSQAFKRTSIAPIDETLALTKAQMVAVSDTLMPAYYFTICQDDGKVYLYDKSATPSVTTGKFTEFSGGGGSGSGHTILDTDGNPVADEPKLQFIGLDVTDNSSDGITEVESATLNQDSLDDVMSAGAAGNQVAGNGLVYSTTEQIVGKWIDGKPIYQKAIDVSSVVLATNQWVDTSISFTCETIIYSKAVWVSRQPSGSVAYQGQSVDVRCTSAGKLSLYTPYGNVNPDYIIVQYTKVS